MTIAYYVIKGILYLKGNAFKQMNCVKYILNKVINVYYVNMLKLMEDVKHVVLMMNHCWMDNVSQYAGMD